MVLLGRCAWVVVLLWPLAVSGIIAVEYPCGDCNRDGASTVEELAECASAVEQGVATCPACDIDGDGEVTQGEVDMIVPPPLTGLPECRPVRIDIGSAGRDANGKVFIPVTLDSGRFSVGGTQNDILFDNTVLSLPSAARCRINPAINAQSAECENDPNDITAPCKNLLAGTEVCGGDPQPDGCPPGAGSNITRLRSLVTAFSVPVFNAIPNGTLYECEFDVIDAGALPAILTNAEADASEPLGQAIFDVVGADGQVTDAAPPTPVGGTATPTLPLPSSTPTLSLTPTLTPTGTVPPTPVGVRIVVGSAGADAEGNAVIPVSLFAGGANVGGMQNDILFDNTIVTLAAASSCKINPAIAFIPEECEREPEEIELPCKNLGGSLRRCGTDPQPTGCPSDAGDNVSRFRALIAATAAPNTNPIPDGLLYSCTFQVLDPERLPAALINGNAIASTPFGMPLLPVVASGGAVTDEPPPLPTPTASATLTPSLTPTATATATPTDTPTASPSATSTATPTASASATPTATPIATASPTATSPPPCAGDCDGSASVTVDEITLLVSVALGTQELGGCTAGDGDGDEVITVDEVIAALTNGLNGC